MDPDVAERRSGRFNSTSNVIHQWEGAGVPRVSNMEEDRHPQPQYLPYSQSAELDIQVVEWGRIHLSISIFSYVWNGLYIYLKVCTIGVCGIYLKNDRENYKRLYEVQIEGPYPAEKLQTTRVHIQSNEQLYNQVRVSEVPKNTQEEYPQINFIPYLHSDMYKTCQ